MKNILILTIASLLLTACSFSDKKTDEAPVPNTGQEFQQPQVPIE